MAAVSHGPQSSGWTPDQNRCHCRVREILPLAGTIAAGGDFFSVVRSRSGEWRNGENAFPAVWIQGLAFVGLFPESNRYYAVETVVFNKEGDLCPESVLCYKSWRTEI